MKEKKYLCHVSLTQLTGTRADPRHRSGTRGPRAHAVRGPIFSYEGGVYRNI